jgi:hypothetical protein
MTSKDRNDGKCEYNRGCPNDVYKLPDYFESTILIVSSSNPTRSNTKCVNPGICGGMLQVIRDIKINQKAKSANSKLWFTELTRSTCRI